MVLRVVRQAYVYYMMCVCVCVGKDVFALAKSIKLHLYWAMKNCQGNPQNLCDMVDNIVNHYIVRLQSCYFLFCYCALFRVTIVAVFTILLATLRDILQAKLCLQILVQPCN